MQRELVEFLACPHCYGRIKMIKAIIENGEIWDGQLLCLKCRARFPIMKGMPHLYKNDPSWLSKAREAQGWVTLHKELGIYEQGSDAVDLKIPYFPEEPWLKVARSFDIALSELDLEGSEKVLDLGAGRGWAAKEFSVRGCQVVALDVTPDDNVGLGRAHTLMQHRGVYFERVIGDGENLPFQMETFDLVFCAAALHHSSDLPLLMHNINRVLKPGGLLCAINEPSLSILDNERDVLIRDAEMEMQFGINENRPTIINYYDALFANNFEIVKAVPGEGQLLDNDEFLSWASDMGVILEFPSWKDPKRFLWRLYIYLRKRVQAVLKGALPHSHSLTFEHVRDRLAFQILLWNTQELFLLARKHYEK